MKKILFASTALVATAGIAAADIEFSGEAAMGFKFVDGAAEEWTPIADATLSVAMTGETDGGLAFGADFDITAGAGNGAAVVYIEGGFGKFSMGDVDTASQSLTGLSDIGFDGLGTDNIAEFLRGSTDARVTPLWAGVPANALYEGTFGDFSVALSYDFAGSDAFSIAAGYDNGSYSFALGYDEVTNLEILHVQAGADISGFAVDALYSTVLTSGADLDSYGVTVGYTFDAVTVTAAYSGIDFAGTNFEGYGIGVSYDLGGGASVAAGVGEVFNTTVADFGISMEF